MPKKKEPEAVVILRGRIEATAALKDEAEQLVATHKAELQRLYHDLSAALVEADSGLPTASMWRYGGSRGGFRANGERGD